MDHTLPASYSMDLTLRIIKRKLTKSESSMVLVIYTPDQMTVHIHGQHSRGRSLVGTPYLYSAERRKIFVRTVFSSENSLFRKCSALPFGQLSSAKVALY